MRCRIWVVLCAGVLTVVSCAPTRSSVPLSSLPDHAIMFDISYNRAFDHIVRTLRSEGYEIAVADHRSGVIETRPRELPAIRDAGGPFRYEAYFSILVRGGWRDAWAIVNLLVLPSYPKERERIIDELRRQLK
jgi:hypothetical protein